MTTIRRLADSCVLVTTDAGTTLFDPGFFTFDAGQVDLDSIGDVQRVLITHEHADHVKPEFVAWLKDRSPDLTVHGNDRVVALLGEAGVEATNENPAGVSSQDVDHGVLPDGSTVPNRSWTLDGTFTHPGDSHEPTQTAPVMALPLVAPWMAMRQAIEFAERLKPQQVIPIHDFYLTEGGRNFFADWGGKVLGTVGVEFIPLKWGESTTV
jgi:L-ascorbate metabolism protein UlaG (beta-lactamase superfamily)